MAEGWHLRFESEVGGREVRLEEYEPSGELRVTTIHVKFDETKGVFEENSTLMPSVYSPGDKLTIDGVDREDLERQLVDQGGFSETDARRITQVLP